MEALRKLEEEQRMVQLTQLRGFVGTSSSLPNHPDSDRFVAQFVLFLMQPCGELDPVMKCHLISQLMPKMSESFLEEASVWLHEEGFQQCLVGRPSIPSYEENKIDNGPHLLQTHFAGKAMVGLEAMQRANSTLEDFCRSYFMFHEMDAAMPQSIFRYLPVLSFTESYIYQWDSWNEKMLQIPIAGVNNLEAMSQEANRSLICKFAEPFRTDPLRELGLLLEHLGLLTERIGEELAYGKEYWALEQKLCRSLMRNEEISIDDAMRAIHLKSFDYRVLNLLLYQLRGEEVNELHMEFLSISEFLVEISDDLFDYEDDVLENNFNILRMFARIYGASTATTMLAKCITEAEEKYDGILRNLDSELAFKYQKRCEEATREGGKTSGHALGTWSMPPVIADEDSYRSKLSNSDSSAV